MPLHQPIVPQSLVNDVFERVLESIVASEIKPGERVREALLARQLGVSRAVLREALQRLETLRLVTHTPNVGVQVILPSQHDLYELYTMLEALAGLAARLAASQMSADEIAALEAMILRPNNGGADPSGTLDGEEFHCRIARGSRNARLERVICGEFSYQLRFYSHCVTVRPGWSSAARDERMKVLRAIEVHDADRAESSVRTHIRHWRANLLFSGTETGPQP